MHLCRKSQTRRDPTDEVQTMRNGSITETNCQLEVYRDYSRTHLSELIGPNARRAKFGLMYDWAYQTSHTILEIHSGLESTDLIDSDAMIEIYELN